MMHLSLEQQAVIRHTFITAREARGLTLQQAAEQAGMSSSGLSRFEAVPNTNIAFVTIARLATLYGLDLNALAALFGVPSPIPAIAPLVPALAALAALDDASKQFVEELFDVVITGLHYHPPLAVYRSGTATSD